jgi:hypothetical protein
VFASFTIACREGLGPSASPAASVTPVPSVSPDTWIVRDVRVFDGEEVLPRASVLVGAGRMAALGREVPAPPNAEQFDGAGGPLLPEQRSSDLRKQCRHRAAAISQACRIALRAARVR